MTTNLEANAGVLVGGARGATVHVHHRLALALWLAMSAMLAASVLMTWFALSSGFALDMPTLAWPLLGLLWTAAVAGCVWAGRYTMVTMRMLPDLVEVGERGPFRIRTTRCARSALAVPDVSEATDREGDPLFRCLVDLPGDRQICIAESHRRCEVVAVRDRIMEALHDGR